MARIIYGVAGQGFGHSSRSHLIGKHLIDAGHDVMFAASNQSLKYLSQYFGDRVKKIAGLHFIYDQGTLSPARTVKSNILNYRYEHFENLELFKSQFEPFNPDLVITDFEPFSAWWAFLNKVPYISIDHEHMLTMCKLQHNTRDWFSRMTADFVTRFYYAGASSYLILNFFKAQLKHKKAILSPPVVRDAVRKRQPSKGDHVVFYSTDCTFQDKLINILKNYKHQKFHIYGFDQDWSDENCVFKKTNTDNFLDDLASSKGVIATAGFSLISECKMNLKNSLLSRKMII